MGWSVVPTLQVAWPLSPSPLAGSLAFGCLSLLVEGTPQVFRDFGCVLDTGCAGYRLRWIQVYWIQVSLDTGCLLSTVLCLYHPVLDTDQIQIGYYRVTECICRLQLGGLCLLGFEAWPFDHVSFTTAAAAFCIPPVYSYVSVSLELFLLATFVYPLEVFTPG